MNWLKIACTGAASIAILLVGQTFVAAQEKLETENVEQAQTADNTSQATGTTGDKDDPQVELRVRILNLVVDKLEIDELKKSKMTAIIDSSVSGLVVAEKRFKACLTDEQHTAYDANYKLAKDAAFTEERALNYALKKLKLDDEKLKEYIFAREELRLHNVKLHNELASLLAPEQRFKLPLFPRKFRSKRMFFHLPAVSSEQDRDQVIKIISDMSDIKLYAQVEPSTPLSNPLRVVVKDKAKVIEALDKLIKEGTKSLVGYRLEAPELSK